MGRSEWLKSRTFLQPSVSAVRCHSVASSGLDVHANSYVEELVKTAKTIAFRGRGILAMDDSNDTCGNRSASIGLENTEANSKAYRTFLVSAPGPGSTSQVPSSLREAFTSTRSMGLVPLAG